MKKQTLIGVLAILTTAFASAQNTTPYWSLAGNSNASASSILGTTNNIPLRLYANGGPRAFIATNGNFGIGTTSPQQRLHVEGTSNQAIFVSTSALGPISGSGQIGYTKYLPTAAGDRLGYFLLGSRGGGEFNYNVAGMVGYAGGAWTTGSRPAYLSFETTAPLTTARAERMRIDPSGNVGIGTSSPSASLDVTSASSFTIVKGISTFTGSEDRIGILGEALNTTNWGVGVQGRGGWKGVDGFAPENGLTGVFGSGPTGVYGDGKYMGVYGNGLVDPFIGYYGTGVNGNGYVGVSGVATYDYDNDVLGTGVYGLGFPGVYGEGVNDSDNGTGGVGVYGYSDISVGVFGASDQDAGMMAYSNEGVGIFSQTNNPASYAGYFAGDVYTAGTYQSSDRHLKQNINDIGSGLAVINKLLPKTYEYRQDGKLKQMNLPGGKHYGLIAQDVEQVLPNLVKQTSFETGKKSISRPAIPATRQPDSSRSGMANSPATFSLPAVEKNKGETVHFKAVNYTELIPILVKAVQELSTANELLTKELAEIKSFLSKSGQRSPVPLSGAYLEQNAPNPARSSTSIRYHVDESAAVVQLTLTNSKGQLLKTLAINGRGAGQVALDTTALPIGVYSYTLRVDGREVDTKQLVISR